MNSRFTRESNFGSRRGFVLASDGGRNFPMEYDDGEFTNKGCQLAEKDGYQSNTEGHQQRLPRFDIGEHIGVQLGFDSLEESVLLQDQSQREEAWGSHFSREENGVLGLEAVSQNIEFSSTTTETCTISRHINVWSEATSTESVQMLLNSVGEEEGKLVEEPTAQESLSSNIVAVLDSQAERLAETDQQGSKGSAMEGGYHNQKDSNSSELASGNTPEVNNASRPENEGYNMTKEDTCESFQMLHRECGQQSAMTASTQQVQANFEHKKFQVASSPVLAECNEEKAGRHATEAAKKDELLLEDQGLMSTVHDETINDITEKNATQEHTRSISSEKPLLDKTIKDPGGSFQANFPLLAPLKGIETANEQDAGKMEVRIEQMKVDTIQYDTEKHMAGVSVVDPIEGIETANEHDLDMQETIEQMKADNNQYDTEKHVTGVSHVNNVPEKGKNHDGGDHVIDAPNEDVLLASNDENSKFDGEQGNAGEVESHGTSSLLPAKANDKGALANDDTLATKQIMQAPFEGDSKPNEPANDKSSHEPASLESKEISASLESKESSHLQKDALGVTTENAVLVEAQRDTKLLQSDNEDGGGKHVTKVLIEHKGEQGMAVSDKSMEKSTGNSLKTAETVIMTLKGVKFNNMESRIDFKSLVANSVLSEDDQNHKVSLTSAEELMNDGTGSLARDAAKECLLEDNESINLHEFENQEPSTPEQCHISSDICKNHGNECKSTSVESIPTDRENETMDKIDFSESKIIAPVDKKIAGTVLVQEPEMLTYPSELATTGKCQKPLQTLDVDDKVETDPIERADQKEGFEKGVEEVNVLHSFKAEADQNSEKVLEASCHASHNESSSVKECDAISLEVGSIEESEMKGFERADQKESFERGVEDVNVLQSFKAEADQNSEVVLEASFHASHNESSSVKECDAISLEVGSIKESEMKGLERADQKEGFERGVEDVNVLQSFKAEADQNSEMVLEASCHASHNSSVKECDAISLEVGSNEESEMKGFERADRNKGFEKEVEEVNMLHSFKAEADNNSETVLEAGCHSSHIESATVKECDAISLEAGSNEESEKKNVSTESVAITMEIDSAGIKEMALLSHAAVETSEHNSVAVTVQDNTKETVLTAGQVMTDITQEPLQVPDACHSPVAVKEVNTSHDLKVPEDKDKETIYFDDQKCMPVVICPGDSSQQTCEVSLPDISEKEDLENAEKDEQYLDSQRTGFSLKEAEESEKDADVPEAMEVTLEVGISLEPDNEFPARDEDGITLQGKASVDNTDLASSGNWSVNSKAGGSEMDMLGTVSGDLEGSAVHKTDDMVKYDVRTKDATSRVEIVASGDFVSSDQVDKNAGCQETSKATQSIEVIKDNASTRCQSEEVQAEICQENANDHVSRNQTNSVTDSIVQEGQVNVKHVQSEEKLGEENGTKESKKKSMTHQQKAADDQVPSTSIANSTQSTSSSALQTSTLPDLNATVAPTSVLFQQPFTDSQQVQLRAQILVYGSLIQGALPEEALMLTAFADIGGASQNDTPLSDGGRGLWENAWHSAAERIHRKTFSHTAEAPVNASVSGTPATVSSKVLEGMKTPPIVNVSDSRNSLVQGLRSADLAASRSHSLQTRVTGTPNIGRTGGKNVASAIMTPPRPVTLPSSMWGMSSPVNEGMQGINIPRSLHVDPHQMAVARHLYQSPQLGHYPPPGNSNPWLSPLHFPGPWLTPPQGTTTEPGLPFTSFLVPEVAQETHNNRRTPPSSSVPHPSMTHGITHFPSTAVASTVHVTNANMDNSKGIVGSGKQSNSEQKSRKRKKKSVSEEITASGGLTPSGPKVKSVTAVSKHIPGSIQVLPQGPSKSVTTSTNALYTPSTNVPPISNYQVIARGETGQRVIFSEETASRIEQARLNAEEAASSAASAVRHSQGIWSQLAVQKSSGLVSECEAKLASAAVAAAAAASVAKAAAAAAKVASDAAVQAKLMATEALNSDGKPDSGHSTEARLLEGSQGHSRSIISAARETAKKRVEAASAATKRAENLDAVVRAAELAAQAVSQAGAVVAMGDPVPLTLNALLESGPENYWKLVTEQASTRKDDNVQNEMPPHEVTTSVEKNSKQSKSKNKRDALQSDSVRNPESVKSSSADMLKLVEKGCRLIPTVPLNNMSTEKDRVGQKENQLKGTAQSSVHISDAEGVSKDAVPASEAEHITETYKKALPLKANEIKDGSFVEVVSDEEGLRGVWFAAKVLSLKDGKALVLYDELLSDEGPGQLQEWIPLEGENGKPPRIRMAHPMTVMKFEGTRKRRRAAVGNYVWSVGDRVDAWIRDGWWEGIITEKKDDDDSKLTVHFPGEGDTSIIKVYNLRPSLIWEDGQWVEWRCLKAGKEGAHEDELPSEKRQKVDNQDSDGQTKGKEKLQKIPNLEEAKKMQELNALMSSGKDKSITVLKNSTFDGSSAGIRVNQLGFQKEGSKLVFGVPKPTKKRKFMDVSKHYVADKTIRNSPERKFDKHKVPISHSHIGFKAASKVDDKRFKRPVISKPKDFKFGRGHEGQSKTKPEKDKSSVVNPTVTKQILGQELGQSAVPAFGIDGSKGGRRVGHGGANSSTKSDSEQGSKGKLSSASENSSLNIEKAALRQETSKEKISEKVATDVMEPRRSNRRIQPTSRLLEGLQTSPITLKSSHMGFSHEKGGKAQSKHSSTIPKGNTNG